LVQLVLVPREQQARTAAIPRSPVLVLWWSPHLVARVDRKQWLPRRSRHARVARVVLWPPMEILTQAVNLAGQEWF
jgi:hypothetical protein